MSTMLIGDKWDTKDYNYCEEHDMYYKEYCCGCALYGCEDITENENESK